MPVIHSDGLFDGERINTCSIMAQLYYPRLLCASNGYGRINLNYIQLCAKAFPRWEAKSVPSETEMIGYIQEFVRNRLLYVYESNGQLWGQWDSRPGTFGKYQTSEDKRSPAPPAEFSGWLEENRKSSEKISKPCGNFAEILRKGSEILPHGVGVGVGVTCEVLGNGVGVHEKPSAHKPRGPRPNSQTARAMGETRHARIQGMIMTWYQEWAGLQCPWDGAEGKQLQRLIRSTPDWRDEQIAQCLTNIAASRECISVGSPPHEWLAKIPKFVKSPLDRYWKPVESANGKTEKPSQYLDAAELRKEREARRAAEGQQ